MTRRLAIILLACGAVAGAARDASACTCFRPGPDSVPACQAAWEADAVFVGTVVEIVHRTTPVNFRVADTRVRVTEVFRGDVPPEIEFVQTSTCDYAFAADETYVIYARRREAGQLWVDLCSRTSPIASVADLDYLRSLSGPSPTAGTIEGTTARREGAAITATQTPLAGVRVTAESGGRVWSAVSGDDGRYHIEAPPGTYRLTAEAPPGYSASFAPASRASFASVDPDTVTVPNTRACVNAGWWISPD
jgi:hypothetical protein